MASVKQYASFESQLRDTVSQETWMQNRNVQLAWLSDGLAEG